MDYQVVYDVLMPTEIEARSPADAANTVASNIAAHGIDLALNWTYEVIRDDNVYGTKDNFSRHHHGFAIFTSAQKLELLTRIAQALDAAGRGESKPGNDLLAQLTRQFSYLDNSTLEGVHL